MFARLAGGLAIAVILAGNGAHGATYYVSSSGGSDLSPGTSPSTAWQSLKRASTISLQPNDSLLLKRSDEWIAEKVIGLFPPLCLPCACSDPVRIAHQGCGVAFNTLHHRISFLPLGRVTEIGAFQGDALVLTNASGTLGAYGNGSQPLIQVSVMCP